MTGTQILVPAICRWLRGKLYLLDGPWNETLNSGPQFVLPVDVVVHQRVGRQNVATNSEGFAPAIDVPHDVDVPDHHDLVNDAMFGCIHVVAPFSLGSDRLDAEQDAVDEKFGVDHALPGLVTHDGEVLLRANCGWLASAFMLEKRCQIFVNEASNPLHDCLTVAVILSEVAQV